MFYNYNALRDKFLRFAQTLTLNDDIILTSLYFIPQIQQSRISTRYHPWLP